MTKLIFDKKTHRYFCGDKEVPSVTTILQTISKPKLYQWYANTAVKSISSNLWANVYYTPKQLEDFYDEARLAPNKKKEESSKVGRAVHKFIEEYAKGKDTKPPEDPIVRGYIKCFLNWVEEQKIDLLESEVIVFNKRKDYCGTLDLIGERDGKLLLIDIKTGKAIYPEYLLQTAAYQAAYPKKIDKRVVVKLSSKYPASHIETDEFKKDYKGFLGALGTFNFVKEYYAK